MMLPFLPVQMRGGKKEEWMVYLGGQPLIGRGGKKEEWMVYTPPSRTRTPHFST
jgi:hypothetical protein